ncbi:hypothetical protein ACHAXR_010971 [Thalassiosira sp. AJA248-18]
MLSMMDSCRFCYPLVVLLERDQYLTSSRVDVHLSHDLAVVAGVDLNAPRDLNLNRGLRQTVNDHRLPSSCAISPSTSFSSSSFQSPKSQSKQPSTWERSAKLVKNTDVTNDPYLEQVRAEVVDPALYLKSIEDELCGAIGKALGRQGEKVLFAIRDMTAEHTQYLEHLQNQSFEKAIQAAKRHNECRKRALTARWEFLVHRQAAGCTVDNHQVVHKTFLIGDALPVKMEELLATVSGVDGENPTQHTLDANPASAKQPTKKVWGDQLSWWQRVGRWK